MIDGAGIDGAGIDGAGIEDLLRDLAPQVLSALLRRYGDFDTAEDAVQEALLAAATKWPRDGLPEHPRGWLITVASRRLTDQWRRDATRRRGEDAHARTDIPVEVPDRDDSLALLFCCAHPALSRPSQVALTLRAVGGLRTAEIASAFLVPESTMTRRITRAKQRIAEVDLRLPDRAEWDQRLATVLRVLYLIFNEGYTASHGARLHRPDLTVDAIRLATALHRQLPDDGEVAGLLALMLLIDARHPARSTADGALVPLADQDRTLWKQESIAAGTALLTTTLANAPIGPYQLQAAIAAVHDDAASAADTDWPQIVGLYDLLRQLSPGPVVALNHAIAVAMVRGPAAGLALLDTVDLPGSHRVDAARAHLLELAGDPAAARTAYLAAARRTTSLPERRYLESRAAALTTGG